jgi:redox-sensitive bicupin YhaK (pirin superfamily)
MDDMLDKTDDEPAGGPHPHAGFETVTLLLEGQFSDGIHNLKAGDLQLMTAGSGIIHAETIDTRLRMRLLQLWLNLPLNNREAAPRVQDIPLEHVPVATTGNAQVRVYSGSLAGVTSPLQNYTPLIIADVTIQPGGTTQLDLPASNTTFLYMLEGEVTIGDEKIALQQDEVGWLEKNNEPVAAELQVRAGNTGSRFVLYSAEPQKDEIITHGPFVADNQEDIKRLYREFRQGEMKHISSLPVAQRILY